VTTQHRIRKEIQFLRAVAVSLVVLSHTGIPQFHGGFVGVDMFFVISGYVIGLSLLREQLSTGRVSVIGFIQRRFFRIFPPLSLVVVVASIYAYLILPIDKSQDFFIQQAWAALFSYSNFHFMFHQVDYFLSNPNVNFFLHTWSLGIEEQFYLLVPVLIFLISKLRRKNSHSSTIRYWNIAFIAVFLLSVFCSIAFSVDFFDFASHEIQSLILFFSPLTRAWEFLMGILIAINGSRGTQRVLRQVPFLGIVLISFAMVGSRVLNTSQFLSSSLAAIGTGLVIFALSGSNTWIPQVFGIKVFSFIGDRSYSIYLWHWIAVAIAEDLFQKTVSREKLGLIILSLIPACLSYKYIELPFKEFRLKSVSKKARAAIFLFAAPALSLVLLNTLALKSREDYGNVYVQTVINDCDYWERVCSIGEDSARDQILLLGDSHAFQLIPIFQRISSDQDVQITTCVKVCFEGEYSKISDGSFRKEQEFDLVVTMFKTNTGVTSRETRMDLSRMISEFSRNRNSKFMVVLDNPFFEGFKAARRIRYPDLNPIPRGSQVLSEEVRLDWAEDADSEVIFFDTFNDLCSESECWVEKNGKVLYVDNNHLSMPGVQLLEPSLIDMVNKILAQQ
jgi:peptidoglycan/LPS O-acetylase OafA/YrhL